MGIKSYKPYTPSRRFATTLSFEEITKDKPERRLTTATKRKAGRDSAGRIAIGSEVRIVLDAAPQYVIPATISFVASQAQFTPKTVETANERQKLMFRVRAQISAM